MCSSFPHFRCAHFAFCLFCFAKFATSEMNVKLAESQPRKRVLMFGWLGMSSASKMRKWDENRSFSTFPSVVRKTWKLFYKLLVESCLTYFCKLLSLPSKWKTAFQRKCNFFYSGDLAALVLMFSLFCLGIFLSCKIFHLNAQQAAAHELSSSLIYEFISHFKSTTRRTWVRTTTRNIIKFTTLYNHPLLPPANPLQFVVKFSVV